MHSRKAWWVVVAYVLLFCSAAFGQSTFGTVAGSVLDPSGAAIPGAQVNLSNLSTGEKRSQTTGSDGIYSFVNLNPGQYRIEVEKSGFKHFMRGPVVVEVNQAVQINATMELGQVSQTVKVTAQTPLLQPQTSSVGQVIQRRLANELPLNGRNVFNLFELAPSVVPQGQSTGTPVGTNPFGWGNYQVGGSFANESAEYVDGQPLNIGYINLPVLIPTQDSVQEFKVQTNNTGPEWGKFSGGVMNIVTKSGTNQFHGEAYEYLRNKVLNANNFFNNAAGIPRAPFTQNQYGGNFGGPVIIPHVYNGRDKTWFFFSYEGFRLRSGETFVTSVPTAAERQGNFSGLTDINGNPITISDPFTGQPYANNTIPQNQLNPTSQKLLNLWPNPTGPGFFNNYAASTSTGGNNNNVTGRVDQVIGDHQHLAARFIYYNVLDLPIDPLGSGVCQDRCTEIYHTYAGDVDYTNEINPTTVLDLNLSSSRFLYNRAPNNAGFDLTTIGWPASFNAAIPAAMRTPPTPCVAGMADTIMCSQGQSFIQDRNTQYNISPSVTMIHGRHTIKFGGQVEIGFNNYAQTNVSSGSFAFCAPGQNCFSNNAGFGFSDFLLGYADNPASVENHFFGQAVVPALTAEKQVYWSTYFGDTWRLTNKLTLNLGVRYEQQRPWTERYDRQDYFDPNAPSPFAQASGLYGLKGNVLLVNSAGDPTPYNVPVLHDNVAPRVGFAYALNSKTVIRSGYGIFWIPTYASFGVNPNNNTINDAATSYVGTINGTTPSSSISNPFPQGISAPPGRSGNTGLFAANVSSINEVQLSNHPGGYVQQYNFGIQRELPYGLFGDVAYVGSKGTHLPVFAQQIDQLPDPYLSMGSQLLSSAPNPFFGLITAGPLSQPTTTVGQLLRPYPQYTGLSLNGQGSFFSKYNALEVTLRRRFPAGGQLLVAYTQSKLVSNTDTLTQWLESSVGQVQDWNNLGGESSLSSQDASHRAVISYVLDLPVGHGQRFLSGSSGPVGKAVSGWGVDGVTTFQSGFPLPISNGTFNGTTLFGGGSRPNVVQGCNPVLSGNAESRLNQWFNTACFTAPANFTYGNESRTDPHIRVDHISNFDFAIFKNTNFGPEDRYGVQFRTEFFNIFNKPQFGYPNASFGSPTFGQVTSQINNPRLIQFALKFQF